MMIGTVIVMNKPQNWDDLRKQYITKIRETYRECKEENRAEVDFGKLNLLLRGLMLTAMEDGIPFDEFEVLVTNTVPEVSGQLSFLSAKRAA